MSTAVKYLKLSWHYLKFNLQSAMEYRASFISQVTFMILNDALLLFFWWIFFSRFNQIKGWEMNDILLLYAVSAGGFGFAAVFFGNCMKLGELIANGQLDFYLALPRNPLIHILISRTSIAGIGDLFFGIGIYFFSRDVNLVGFLILLSMIMCSGLVLTSFSVLAYSAAFFFGNSVGFGNLYTNMLVTFSLYPGFIFKGFVKFLLFTILPASFLAYLPSEIIKEFNIWTFLIIIGFTVFSILSAYSVFNLGLKKYESGNLIITRL